jgi:hypothetical protein
MSVIKLLIVVVLICTRVDAQSMIERCRQHVTKFLITHLAIHCQ